MLVKIGIHISVRILHTEFLLDIGCQRHERFQFFVGLVFSQLRQLHQHMLEIGVFLTGLAKADPLRIGKDLIHRLQLPPQLVIFCFQLQDGFFQCSHFGSGICGSLLRCSHSFSLLKIQFLISLLCHKPVRKYRKYSLFQNFSKNKSLSLPFRIAVFCSIRSPSMSQRKL